LIDTLTLQGEEIERHVPDGFQALVRRNGVPERPVERAIVFMQANKAARTEAATFVWVHPTVSLL
jgi:hypothetical protein